MVVLKGISKPPRCRAPCDPAPPVAGSGSRCRSSWHPRRTHRRQDQEPTDRRLVKPRGRRAPDRTHESRRERFREGRVSEPATPRRRKSPPPARTGVASAMQADSSATTRDGRRRHPCKTSADDACSGRMSHFIIRRGPTPKPALAVPLPAASESAPTRIGTRRTLPGPFRLQTLPEATVRGQRVTHSRQGEKPRRPDVAKDVAQNKYSADFMASSFP
jgi:hypothetical protein